MTPACPHDASVPGHQGEVYKNLTRCIDCNQTLGAFHRFCGSGHVGCLSCSMTWQNRMLPA